MSTGQVAEEHQDAAPVIAIDQEPTIHNRRKQMRQWELDLLAALPPIPDNVEESYSSVTLPDGHTLPIKIFHPRPSTPDSHQPLILLFHGGAFNSCSVDQLTRPARDFCSLFSAIVVVATYRLAPEHPFPQQANDTWDIFQHISRHAQSDFNADLTTGFIVGGYSAGGTLASVVTQRAVEQKTTPPITGSFIAIAPLMTTETVPDRYRSLWTSRELKGDDIMITSEGFDDMLSLLQPDIYSPLFSPINAPSHAGWPKTYFQVCGLDAVRDDGVVYEKMLKDEGVQTRIDCFPDLAHAGWTIFADEEKSPRELRDKTMEGMKWLLGRE